MTAISVMTATCHLQWHVTFHVTPACQMKFQWWYSQVSVVLIHSFNEKVKHAIWVNAIQSLNLKKKFKTGSESTTPSFGMMFLQEGWAFHLNGCRHKHITSSRPGLHRTHESNNDDLYRASHSFCSFPLQVHRFVQCSYCVASVPKNACSFTNELCVFGYRENRRVWTVDKYTLLYSS